MHTQVFRPIWMQINKLALHQQRMQEEKQSRQSQYQKGLKGLFNFVLGRTYKLRQKHQAEYETSLERDRLEKDALLTKQRIEREKLQPPIHHLQSQHQAHMHMLNTRFMQSIEKLGLEQAFTRQLEREITPPIFSNPPPTLEL